MAYFGFNQEAQVTTGNVRTTQDLYDSTALPTGPQIISSVQVSKGAKNTLGQAYYEYDATSGFWTKYRYCTFSSSDTTAVIAYPAPVFWVDEYNSVVTGLMSESITTTQQSIAGWMMPNTTDLTTLTLANLKTSFVWVAVGGFVKNAASAASVTLGDWLIGSSGAWVPVRVASGTASGYRLAAYATAAVAGTYYNDIFIVLET